MLIYMSDEEGFSRETEVELVDYNYNPQWGWVGSSFESLSGTDYRTVSGSQVARSILPTVLPTIFDRGRTLETGLVTFSTAFPGANLGAVQRKKTLDYILYMSADSNTNNHFQWFYFKARVRRPRLTVRFTICNFVKSTMLYSKGLRPFSRPASSPSFLQVDSEVNFTLNENQYYSLSWNYEFKQSDEDVEFASQPPYGQNELNALLRMLPYPKLTLCRSAMGHKVPCVIINEGEDAKTICLVVGRQHPGEAAGSWLIEGFLKYLASIPCHPSIQWIVVPILNVDGVVLGNNRTGLSGHDFNRNWNIEDLNKKSTLFPENCAFLRLIKNIRKKHPNKLKLFLDFHAHSSQPNVFAYGPPHDHHSELYFASRVLPELIERRNPHFSIPQCSYTILTEKRRTLRSLLFYTFNVPFTYTIECSFGVLKGAAASTKEFLQMGEDIAASCVEFVQSCILPQKAEQKLLDEVKLKYRDCSAGEEFDSGSEESVNEFFLEKNSSKNADLEKIYRVSSIETKRSIQREKVISSDWGRCKQKLPAVGFRDRISTEGPKECRLLPLLKRCETKVPSPFDAQTSIHPSANISSFIKIEEKGFKESSSPPNVEVNPSFPKNNETSFLRIKDLEKILFKRINCQVGSKILIINAEGKGEMNRIIKAMRGK